jgi:hypothetical protein
VRHMNTMDGGAAWMLKQVQHDGKGAKRD